MDKKLDLLSTIAPVPIPPSPPVLTAPPPSPSLLASAMTQQSLLIPSNVIVNDWPSVNLNTAPRPVLASAPSLASSPSPPPGPAIIHQSLTSNGTINALALASTSSSALMLTSAPPPSSPPASSIGHQFLLMPSNMPVDALAQTSLSAPGPAPCLARVLDSAPALSTAPAPSMIHQLASLLMPLNVTSDDNQPKAQPLAMLHQLLQQQHQIQHLQNEKNLLINENNKLRNEKNGIEVLVGQLLLQNGILTETIKSYGGNQHQFSFPPYVSTSSPSTSSGVHTILSSSTSSTPTFQFASVLPNLVYPASDRLQTSNSSSNYDGIATLAPPKLSFREAMGRWLQWEHKDKNIDKVDLSMFLFNPSGEQKVPQTVRKVQHAYNLFLKHRASLKVNDGTQHHEVWNHSDTSNSEWESKAQMLLQWQKEQIKMGLIVAKYYATMTEEKRAAKRKATGPI